MDSGSVSSTSPPMASSDLPVSHEFTVTVSETPSSLIGGITSPSSNHSTQIAVTPSQNVDSTTNTLLPSGDSLQSRNTSQYSGSTDPRTVSSVQFSTITENDDVTTTENIPTSIFLSETTSQTLSTAISTETVHTTETVVVSTFSESTPATSTHSKVTETATSDDVTTVAMTPAGGLSQGAVIGIAVGVSVVAIIIVIVVVIFAIRMKRNSKRGRYHSEDNLNDYKLDLPTAKNHRKNGPDRASLTNKPTNAPYFQHDPEPDPTEHSPDGMTNTSYNLDLDTAVQETEMDYSDSIIRNHDRDGPMNRAIIAESRYSLGPIMLGDIDDGISTSAAYSKVYSTNTFK